MTDTGGFEASSNVTAYASLQKDFERVLSELVSDQSLEKFRVEYEKLHHALQASHENEKKLIAKCQELNRELKSNAAKVGTAMRLSSEDQNSIALLKNEIDKAWKMVDTAQNKEKQAKRTVQQLRAEINNLSTLVERGAGLNIGQETTVNELLRMKQQLKDEVQQCNTTMEEQQKDINALTQELNDTLQKYNTLLNEHKGLKQEITNKTAECQQHCRRADRTEQQLLEMKQFADDTKEALNNKNADMNEMQKKMFKMNQTLGKKRWRNQAFKS